MHALGTIVELNAVMVGVKIHIEAKCMNLEMIEKYNYWNSLPEDIGLIRNSYLASLKHFLGSPAMIVVSGARRVGKSVLMKQFITSQIETGTPPKNILYLNLFIR